MATTRSATSRAATRSSASCSSSSASRRARDRLWLVGDLVNRGPESLAVLREVKALGDAAVTVLGNHDFHLLTVAAGHTHAAPARTRSTPILEAPDRDELARLARAPAAGRRRGRAAAGARRAAAVVDAGDGAVMLSREVEAMLAGDRRRRVPRACSTATSRARWRDDLAGLRPPARDRQRVHAAALLHRRRHDGVPREARARAARRTASARGSSIRTARSARDDGRLRPLVDARTDARAERADARLGLPVGRHADRGQAPTIAACSRCRRARR